MPAIAGLVVSAAYGGYKVYQGEKEKKEAEKLRQEAGSRPKQRTPQSEMDNLALATNRAGQGFTDSTLNNLYGQNDRGLSSAIAGILRNGGSANNVSDIYSKYTDANAKIQFADDAAKVSNIKDYMQQNSRQSAYADKQFQINEMNPWKDAMSAAAAKDTAGQNQTNSGIATIASGIGGGIGSAITANNFKVNNTARNGGGGGSSEPQVVLPVTAQEQSNLNSMVNANAGNPNVSNVPDAGVGDYPQYQNPFSQENYYNNFDWTKVSPESMQAFQQLMQNQQYV